MSKTEEFQPKESFRYILDLTRAFNSQLPLERYSLLTLQYYASELARQVYQQQKHWHSYDGKCAREMPFEIYMEAVALISCVWVADIYRRKSRDRKAPQMATRYDDWESFLKGVLEYTKKEVSETRDIPAERDYQRKAKRPSRIKCWINRLRWGH